MRVIGCLMSLEQSQQYCFLTRPLLMEEQAGSIHAFHSKKS